MNTYIFLSLLGSAVVLGAGLAIGGFQVLKHISKGRAQRTTDHARVALLKKTAEQIVIRQKAIFVMAVVLLGVLLFARTFSH